MLEAGLYTDNTFFTLTYRDEHLPEDLSLHPRHAQLFLKRLRKLLEPFRIRYFLVGEYGETTFRPHYHDALFNYPACQHGECRITPRRARCCVPCNTIADAWPYGRIHTGSLNLHTAAYIAGYVTKKLTEEDLNSLGERHPEFTRMSLRPGIGADAIHDIASTHLEHNIVETQGDVVSALRANGKTLPLGRYLTRRLRRYVGIPENAPAITLARMAEQMHDVLENSKIVQEVEGQNPYSAEKLRRGIIEKGHQTNLNIAARNKIYKQKRTI